MDFIANHRIFTQEELNFIQTEKFNNEFVGKSNEKEFERYLKDTNDLYADKIEYTKSIVKELFGIVDIFRISHLGIIYICFDSIGQYFDARSVLYRYGKFLKQKRQAIQNKFTSIDKDKFLEIIQEFLDKVDELRSTGKTTGSMPTQFEKSMNEVLQNLDYVCNFSFGQGILSSVPFINFCPKNILNKDLVNGDKLSGRRGIYIGFGYKYNEQKLDLVIECSNNDTQECEAKNEIDKYRPNERKYTYKRDEFGKIKEQIVKDFLNLVSKFNQIPIEYFKPKGAEVIQQTNKSANETNGVPPLNQILYGPPGTGKTYNTINKALEILGYGMQDNEKSKITLDYDKIKQKLQEIAKSEDAKALNLENLDYKNKRELTKLLFDYYHKNKQIEFITFHQSFSYEEFVEGIKPNTDNPENMVYEVQDGIFKKICEKALIDDNKKINILRKNIEIYRNDMIKTIKQIQQPLNYQGVEFKITDEAKDILADNPAFVIQVGNLKQILDKMQNFENIDKIIEEVLSNYVDDKPKLLDYVKRYKAFIDYIENTLLKPEPYILIIDEINRGNISKILGELITLIEPSKRIGADEELRVSLPYSTNEFDGGNGFGVPKNLYIIGTMNTADRSIALLDTALRRRFEFVEMMPECGNENISTNCEGVNLQALLKCMNDRIEFLLDREHTIGHSFFINVNSLSELQQVFKNKIIPLLQEYFYDDYAKIDAVLNGNKMIEITEVKVSSLFSKKDKDLELDDKKIYKITPFENEIWDNSQTYKNIYVGKESNSQEINENE